MASLTIRGVLTRDDLAELERCADALRAEGWASFVTFEHLLSAWRRLAAEVAGYPATVDDYTNDLTSRDGLDLIQKCASDDVARRLVEHLSPIDAEFIAGTDSDDTGVLGRYYRVDEESGWWFRRIPRVGALRDYLSRTKADG